MTPTRVDLPAEIEVKMPSPDDERLSQDREWCELHADGDVRHIRFHDYAEIFKIPGLYEHLFYEELKCVSPETVVGLLAEALTEAKVSPNTLSVLDVGAGNGMVGERLADLGARTLIGADLLPEAAMATERDRPDVYDSYVVGDLTNLPVEERRQLENAQFNCLAIVAALGFGDIPPAVFRHAFSLIQPNGWVAMTINENFLDGADQSGFAGLIAKMVETGELELVAQKRYQHRFSCQGEEIYYVALVGRKSPTA